MRPQPAVMVGFERESKGILEMGDVDVDVEAVEGVEGAEEGEEGRRLSNLPALIHK